MRRIVLAGPGLAEFRSTGHSDEWFRLVFPAEGATTLDQPQLVNGVSQFADPQPISRWYTVRRWDPDRRQLSVDVVIHGHGTASSLTLPAGPGYVWMAGEAACSRDIRRYFRHELGWPSSSYDIVGYWRPDAEAYLQRYTRIEAEVAEIYEASQRTGRDLEETVDDVFAVMEAHGL
jgi:NADPH-dependent ferric siderophore reductase